MSEKKKDAAQKPEATEKKAKGAAKKKSKTKADGSVEKKKSRLKRLGGFLFAKMARGGAAELRSNADEVNKLNVFPVPDGDTGDNMRMTIESGIAAIENLDTDNLAEVMRVLSHGMLLGARGNSGVILSQFFAGVASGFENATEADPQTLGAALQRGVEQAYSTVMTPTEGTILTVAREAVEYAVSKITPKTTIKSFFANLVGEMYASVERTPELLPALKEAGVVDSGGAGLFYIMDGFMRVLNDEKIEDDPPSKKPIKTNTVSSLSFGPESEMEYAYCTELLVQLLSRKCDVDHFDIEKAKEYLSKLGDSIVTVLSGSVVKLHIHTFEPEKVIAYMRSFGEFISVKVENMSLQHTSVINEKTSNDAAHSGSNVLKSKHSFTSSDNTHRKSKKKYGIVAVSSGEGISSLFYELGADEVIFGGQTNNPSAQEFLDAFSKINAEYIFVMPNNSNILLAANQAASIYKDAEVFVLETKSIGTGYAALATFNFESPTPEGVTASAEDVIGSVSSGYVSPAIRDARMDNVDIHEGDTIGIVGKRIVLSNPTRLEAAAELAKILLCGEDGNQERYILTVFVGKDALPKESESIAESVKAAFADVEIYFIDGGQDIYPFIFVAQ